MAHKPPDPKPVRMPVASDPAILAARARAIETAKKRGGRESTILSDALRSVNGSAGQLGR
jgi:hypothetical protein